MPVKYLKDLPIPDLEEWTSDELTNPMHPSHGPLPDHYGMLEYKDQTYLVMLWETKYNVQVFLEWTIQDDPDPRTPRLTIDEACSHQGKLGRSYYWTTGNGTMTCEGHSVTIPQQLGGDDQWRRRSYRKIMAKSVEIAATTLIGL
jgi:hypothetical protein